MNQLKNKEFTQTIEKFSFLIMELKKCLESEDWLRAEDYISTLRSYKDCFYCITYRGTLESRGYDGVCGSCPCHKLGEKLIGRSRSYNGCYLVGPYRNMVKSAFWFSEDPSRESLQNTIKSIEKNMEYMIENKQSL